MLDHFSGYHTRDPDVIRDVTFRLFGGTFFDIIAPRETVFVKANWVKTPGVTLIKAFCKTGADVGYQSENFVRQYFLTEAKGHLEFDVGGRQTILSSQYPSVILPANTRFRVRALGTHDFFSLRLGVSELKQLFRTLTNKDYTREFSFDEKLTSKDPRYQRMKRSVLFYATELESLGPALAPIFMERYSQVLLLNFLYFNDHSLSAALFEEDAAPSLQQLKSIEEFIEANSHRTLKLDVLAAEFNISVRSIFRHFKKMRGISPLEFLKSVRLNESRRMLQTAYSGETVTEIALKCGFHSLGHFSREYRSRFGETPSETIRLAMQKIRTQTSRLV